MRILNACVVYQDSILQTGVRAAAPASPAAHFLCSTACIRQDISTASFCSCKLLWRSDECVLLPCFNAQPNIFTVMNCYVVGWVYFCPISQLGALIVYIQCNDTQNKGNGCRRICILCQQTLPKRWFGNMNMLSNCDVTNSAHQKQMTTICHWMNPPMKIFCVHHWFRQTGLTVFGIDSGIGFIVKTHKKKISKLLLLSGIPDDGLHISRNVG